MVVAWPQPKLEVDAGIRAGFLEQAGPKLPLQEWICFADIDQNVGDARAILDQGHRVV